MNSSIKDSGIHRIKLGKYWTGWLSGSEDTKRLICETLLDNPDQLFSDADRFIKQDGRNCVAVKTIERDSEKIRLVLKRHVPVNFMKQFCRRFIFSKAEQNIKKTVLLRSLGIPVVEVYAALQKAGLIRIRETVLIIPFYENSPNLHHFLEGMSDEPYSAYQIKRQLCMQIAEIFSTLHKAGIWHRDSKSSNLIVTPREGELKIRLVDMDGIKHNLIRGKRGRYFTLWRLAASLMLLIKVNKTDYMRFFQEYCDMMGIPDCRRRIMFRELSRMAEKKYQRLKLRSVLHEL